MIATIIDWEHILDKWGWPTLVLVAVCVTIGWLVRTFIIPQATKYIERSQRIDDESRSAFKDRAERLEVAQTTLLQGFTSTLSDFKTVLDTNAKRAEKQIDMLTEILTEVRINNRTRGKQDT